MPRVQSLAVLSPLALAGLAAAQDAYMVDSNLDQLFTVNVTTGVATLIGSTLNNGLSTPADLTWRASTQQLWTIDLTGGEIGTLDVNSGNFTPVFTASPANGWQGMAWHEGDDVFYLANQDGNNYAFDPATGVTTLLGVAGVGLLTALDVDSAGVLWGVDFGGIVASINTTTGAGTAVSTTIGGFQGLGINQTSGAWFGANTNDDSLHAIDPGTGANTLIGAFGSGTQFSKGFDLVEAPIDAYMIDSNLDRLYSVETSTGTATLIGSTANNGLTTPADLTFRGATGDLWTIDLDDGQLGTLDVTTAIFTPVFTAVPAVGWQGMAWDERTGLFYLANQDDNIYTLDPATGITTLVGDSGLDLITALDTDACGELYGIDFFTGLVVRINKATGAGTALSTTIGGFQGLGIHQISGRWFAANTNDDSLYGVNPGTGAANLIGAFGSGVQFSKGFDLVDRPRAFLVDSNNDELYSVDLATGAATLIANTLNNGLSTPADLSYRASDDTLWTIDLSGGEVGTIDMVTGTFTPAYETGLGGWQGMAWDAATQLFYLANQNGNSYTLDPLTGLTTLQGASGYALLTCLETDGSGNLFGIDFSTGFVVRVDKGTGVGSTLSTTIGGFQGLGIDWTTGTWFGSNSNDDSLHRVDPTTGTNSVIGSHGAGVGFAKGFDLCDIAGTAPATNTRFGTACGGLILAPVTRPAICGRWAFDLALPSSATLGAIVVGFNNPNLSLAPFGAPGCTQYANNVVLAILLLPLGSPAYGLAMPSDAGFVGLSLFAQGYALVPGLNPLGVGASNGVRGVIGHF